MEILGAMVARVLILIGFNVKAHSIIILYLILDENKIDIQLYNTIHNHGKNETDKPPS